MSAADVGKFIAFEVTPVAAEGKGPGEAVLSEYTVAVLSTELLEYGYAVAVLVQFLAAAEAEGVTVAVDGDTTTWTFTEVTYVAEGDPDAVIDGTMVITDDGVTVETTQSFTFSNDDLGLLSLRLTGSGASEADQLETGSVTVNGVETPIADWYAYVDALFANVAFPPAGRLLGGN